MIVSQSWKWLMFRRLSMKIWACLKSNGSGCVEYLAIPGREKCHCKKEASNSPDLASPKLKRIILGDPNWGALRASIILKRRNWRTSLKNLIYSTFYIFLSYCQIHNSLFQHTHTHTHTHTYIYIYIYIYMLHIDQPPGRAVKIGNEPV